jgi:hypothetical protein
VAIVLNNRTELSEILYHKRDPITRKQDLAKLLNYRTTVGLVK